MTSSSSVFMDGYWLGRLGRNLMRFTDQTFLFLLPKLKSAGNGVGSINVPKLKQTTAFYSEQTTHLVWVPGARRCWISGDALEGAGGSKSSKSSTRDDTGDTLGAGGDTDDGDDDDGIEEGTDLQQRDTISIIPEDLLRNNRYSGGQWEHWKRTMTGSRHCAGIPGVQVSESCLQQTNICTRESSAKIYCILRFSRELQLYSVPEPLPPGAWYPQVWGGVWWEPGTNTPWPRPPWPWGWPDSSAKDHLWCWFLRAVVLNRTGGFGGGPLFVFFVLGEVQFESWGPSSRVVDLTFLARVSLSGVPSLLASMASLLPGSSLTGVEVRQGPGGDLVLPWSDTKELLRGSWKWENIRILMNINREGE